MKGFAGIIVLWVLLTGVTSAQTFKLDGVVIDADDHTSMPGPCIKLSYQADSTRATDAQSDLQGKFYFVNLPPAGYVLEIKYIGYKTIVLKPKIFKR